jgi:hypothetical protein
MNSLSNIIPAHVSTNFVFYQYGIDVSNHMGQPINSRRRRAELFNIGLFHPETGLLAKNGMEESARNDLDRVVFFEGSGVYTAREIPFIDTFPFTLVSAEQSLNGDVMTITGIKGFSPPKCLVPISQDPTIKKEDGFTSSVPMVTIDIRCANCTKAFSDSAALFSHCQNTGHSPATANSNSKSGLVIEPSSNEQFTAFCNVALRKAMSERLAKWGREYIDAKTMTEPKDKRGNSLGVRVFRAYSCDFGLIRPNGKEAQLALTVDLKAKLIRTKSILDMICEDRDPNNVRFDEYQIRKAKQTFENEVVICTYDKRCYSVTDIDFSHSPASLPIGDSNMSHAEYFIEKKGIPLKYPNSPPMISVLGRNNMIIHLPAELVCCNELDQFVKMQLPMVASFKPHERNAAIEEMKRFLIPGAQKTKGIGGGLLPALGIILANDRIKVNVEVLPLPIIRAAGVEIPEDKGQQWAPLINRANYNVRANEAVTLNVVLVFHHSLGRSIDMIYGKLRDNVNKHQSNYRFGDRPYAYIEAGDNDHHWGPVERHFYQEREENIFVLDFTKPSKRHGGDPAYSVVKQLLTDKGYLSQFLNFNTCDHTNRNNDRKSNTVLQGVARQVLSKCGVRVWWVNIPRSIPLPAIFVGVDVFHAPRKYNKKDGKRTAKESVAAVVVQAIRSHDQEGNVFAEVYSQSFRRDTGQELDLGVPMMHTITNAMKHLNVDPKSCVIWRDGVGEDSINQVKRDEVPAVREALSSASGPVPLSYMVVQKRISTKFLSMDGSKALPTGSLVRDIQTMDHSTFYIGGTSPPYSTPKPARFIVAQKDKGMDDDQMLAELSWSLCHDYSNWTGPIKLPSPVQMAHKLAELAGGFDNCGETINSEAYTGKIHFL